jgi:protein-tyrosine phosphatase
MDLTDEFEIAPGYSALLRALADDRRTEITNMRVPIPDRSVPSVWTMRCILDVLDRSLADENPAFVHCFAGIDRTGTVVGCYLKRHRLATDQDVMARIAELRRFMPYGRDSSPQTPEQVRMVRTWKAGA